MYHLNYIAVPEDKRINLKEQEKVDSNSELIRASKKIWNLSQVVVVPVAIGALGSLRKTEEPWLKKLDVKSSIKLLQKVALLGTEKIVRKVLET